LANPLIYADGQMGRHDEAVDFCSFANAPKNETVLGKPIPDMEYR